MAHFRKEMSTMYSTCYYVILKSRLFMTIILLIIAKCNLKIIIKILFSLKRRNVATELQELS